MNNAYEPTYKCPECGWFTCGSSLLVAPHPFRPNAIIQGCPNCRAAATMERFCDNPGCDKPVSCGWPSTIGYRWTCATHYDYRNLTEPLQETVK